MNTKERLALAHWAVSEAKKAGADETSINIVNSRDVEVEVRDKKVDKLQESTQNSLRIEIFADKRYSSQSTNDLRRESLARFISEAVATTKYLSEDEFRSLPDPKYYAGQKDIDLNIYDDEYDSLTTDKRVAYAKAIEEGSLSRSDKVLTCNTGFGDSKYESVKVHSNGFEGFSKGTSYSAGSESTVQGKGEGRPSDWCWHTFRFRKDLDKPELLGIEATDRALAKIGQKKMESGIYDMVIENRSVSRLLYSLIGPLNASSIQQKRSFLEGKLGEKIASDNFTIIDDPHIISGAGSRLYDGDGMATKRRPIIENGILKSYYVDWYYGRKLGWEPTTGGTTNLVFGKGDKSLDQLVAQMKKGILITGFIGGNSNSVTGDFSVGIIGTYVEDGKKIMPVNEMNISGNLTNVLQQFVEFGNDPWIYSSWRRPSMYFRDIQFSGI